MIRQRSETVRRSFWLLPALGLLGGVVAGIAITEADRALPLDFGIFAFSDFDAARGVLSTIGAATLSVAGVTFSVTLVALQLASQQLSPRVLTTFREDRLTQATLAVFLGTFSYVLVVLGRLSSEDERVPELALSLAVLAALSALALFVAFVGRIVASLQASTVIRRIAGEAERALRRPHPDGIGHAPDEPGAAEQAARERAELVPGHAVRAREAGYLLRLDGDELIDAARACDGLVVQEAPIGDFVVRGQVVATVHAGARPDLTPFERAFEFGEERRMAGDAAFPLRALADIALRALSPSTNDPTTAENAMGSLVDTIVRWIRTEPGPIARLDAHGTPRLLARGVELDDLVRLGFEQVRLMIGEDHPLLADRLVTWLEVLDAEAVAAGRSRHEIARQRELLQAIGPRSGSSP